VLGEVPLHTHWWSKPLALQFQNLEWVMVLKRRSKVVPMKGVVRRVFVKGELKKDEGNSDPFPIPLMKEPQETLLFDGPQAQNEFLRSRLGDRMTMTMKLTKKMDWLVI
jgi:hypothetical protein